MTEEDENEGNNAGMKALIITCKTSELPENKTAQVAWSEVKKTKSTKH